MKRRTLLIIVLLSAVTFGALAVQHLVKGLNRDKLVVLNSNLERISETDITRQIAGTPVPRLLSKAEIEQISGLLHPANKRLIKDARGKYFRLELRVDGSGRLHLVAMPAE